MEWHLFLLPRALLREEGIWGPNTDQFMPERFLTADGKLNPAVPHPDLAFGFGRRICPGRNIAYSSMMITCASLVQCFNIIKKEDDNGQEITPKVEYTTGLLRCVRRLGFLGGRS